MYTWDDSSWESKNLETSVQCSETVGVEVREERERLEILRSASLGHNESY